MDTLRYALNRRLITVRAIRMVCAIRFIFARLYKDCNDRNCAPAYARARVRFAIGFDESAALTACMCSRVLPWAQGRRYPALAVRVQWHWRLSNWSGREDNARCVCLCAVSASGSLSAWLARCWHVESAKYGGAVWLALGLSDERWCASASAKLRGSTHGQTRRDHESRIIHKARKTRI